MTDLQQRIRLENQLEMAILKQLANAATTAANHRRPCRGHHRLLYLIIDGSKSAEEAFADMLKNMGQALIQQGAIMIAQYIAIGIARLFAGMGGGTPSGGYG